MIQSAEDVYAFFLEFTDFEQKEKQTIREYRLDRMRGILSLFDDPHLAVKPIHIAGSKGKGSTALYIAKMLEARGVKVGLYSSPHVSGYEERISFAGIPVPQELIAEQGRQVADALPRIRGLELDGSGEPTTFELFTLLAFLVFRESRCGYAVIETGIGGRLDATNVVHPALTVITPIEREHTDILGDTLERIAFEKAGIIKEGIPVCISRQHEAARKVLHETARKRRAPFFDLTSSLRRFEVRQSPSGTLVAADLEGIGGIEFHLAMLGSFQAENALLALLAMQVLLREERFEAGSLLESIKNARLPGRLELCDGRPPILLDVAHTPVSVSLVLDTYDSLFAQKPICIFGSVIGKRTEEMAKILCPRGEKIIISRPGTFKPNDPPAVHRVFSSLRDDVPLILEAEEALAEALRLSHGTRPVLILGSFYMVGELRPSVTARRTNDE
jgi:dihydrofolate synthase / folylpolyglutamate synthase